MKCTLCSGCYREGTVILSFRRQGQTMVVEDVPALVCDICGDEIITEDTAREVERLLKSGPQGTAPLYRFPERVSLAS